MVQTNPIEKARSFLAELSRSEKFRPVAMLALAFVFMFAMVLGVATGNVAAAGNNTTDANTLYYGLSVLEWALIAIIFVLLGAFLWLRNIFIFAGFIALVIVEMVVHFFGT